MPDHDDRPDVPEPRRGDPIRLAVLQQYDIMDTEPEEAFDRLTRLAARLIGAPIALITLLDEERQWFKSCIGLEIAQTPRSEAFCAYNVDADAVLVVEDATQDPRFRDHPWVTGDPHIRFYAGAPLVTPEGQVLGSLCVIDRAPRTITASQRATLKELAAIVMDELELRLARQDRDRILEGISDAFYALDPTWCFTYVNREAERVLDRSQSELLGASVWEAFPETKETVLYDAYHKARNENERQHIEFFCTPLATWFSVTAYPHAGGLAVYFRDVTEERTAHQHQKLLATAIEESREAVLITEAFPLDPPGPRIVYVNPAFEAMSGYTAEEIVGQTPRVLQGPRTERAELDRLKATLKAGEPSSNEATNYRKDGTPYRVQWKTAPVRDEDGNLTYWVSVQRDVTEERVREQRLREHRALLEQTQRLAGAWELDLRTHELTWSSEVYRIHEVPEGANVTQNDGISFYAAEAQPIITAAVEHCIETGTPWDLELPLRTAKGNERWVRTVGAVMEWGHGEAVKLAGAFQDITDQYEAKLALHEREQRLRGIADSVPGVLFQFYARPDGATGTRFISAPAEELLGIPRDDFFDRFVAGIPEPHLTRFWASVEEAVQGEATWALEFPFDRPDGERIWLRDASVPVRKEDELVFNGVLSDVTQRKHQEQAREKAFKRMQLALRETNAAIFEVNLRTAEVLHVGGFAELFAQQPDEDLTWEAFAQKAIHPDDTLRMVTFLDTVTESPQEGHTIDVRTHPALGPVRWVRGEIHRIDELHDATSYALGMVQDVTRQKHYEEGLLEAKRHAEEMSRLKSTFLTNMSHEIRTPLTGIIGYAELLAELDLDADATEFAESITHAGQRLLETLTSLLDLSQLEAGALHLYSRPLDLSASVAEIIRGFQARARRKGVALTVDLPETPVMLHTDAGAVERILNNLVGNALKFTPQGGTVLVLVRTRAEEAMVVVEDTGVGIDPAFLPDLFTPFKQESAGIGRAFEGNGLGLAITKQLVDLLGGTITADSVKNQGTTFTLILPPLHHERPTDVAA